MLIVFYFLVEWSIINKNSTCESINVCQMYFSSRRDDLWVEKLKIFRIRSVGTICAQGDKQSQIKN
jgi:hypothetical protein